MNLPAPTWCSRLAPVLLRASMKVAVVVLCFGLVSGCKDPQQSQPSPGPAATRAPVPVDPNVELRAKLDELHTKNDTFEGSIEQLKLLLSLNVCDPQTKARIEELIRAQQANAGGGETLTVKANAGDAAPMPISLDQTGEQTAATARPITRTEISKALQAMTVLVLTENSFGSGVIVGPDRVLTNRHVVDVAGEHGIWILQASLPAPVQAKIAAASPSSEFNQQDFALLALAQSVPSPGVRIAPSQEPLEMVYAAGFPNSIVSNDSGLMKLLNSGTGQMPSPVLSAGAITTVQQNGGIAMIAHSADISPGSSGGPLVNECGELVGINTFITDGGGGAPGKFAISAAVARSFLSQNGVGLLVGSPCGTGAN